MPPKVLISLLQAVAPESEASDTLARSLGEWLRSWVGLSPDTQAKILQSAVAILVVWLIRKLVVRVVDRRLEEARLRYQWSKGSAYVAFVLAIVLVGHIWLEALRSLGTFLGLVGAGLAIALRDPVVNLAGWIFLLWRRPFELGDRIQIGSHAGDVVDVRIFQFTMLEIGNWVDADQSTGRVIHVPNARVFTEPLANYTLEFDYIWNELPVLVTFESDWERAKAILLEVAEEVAGEVVEEAQRAVKRASRKYLIHYRNLTPIVYTTVKESGVLLTVRFLTPARQRRGRSEAMWERILRAFREEPRIELAYPTRRLFLNPLEGKEDARAAPPGWVGRGPGEPPSGAG
ncbi:MAG: mechanosensitive ion channel [Gemmatimonadetes bacterium]|nr:mechanosensitive ion channel family protein [Gemmatimonadota bacterium]NIR77399.1 mechanosensitive ion channel family protein [Gemmatimonadota bacterium]NIT85909.1 mechanosensitive ion channel family protein [Gemmatimonadota bacterium]NIU29735.1 mechanosensitive ion channel family protein [Gemmatimonadota bacterium]NIU34776.1 mechanosensitive ion channel [Gemmatimonadota bacterium]